MHPYPYSYLFAGRMIHDTDEAKEAGVKQQEEFKRADCYYYYYDYHDSLVRRGQCTPEY